MAKIISQSLLVAINYWLVNGDQENILSRYRTYGPRRCVELCKDWGVSSLSMREFHCRRFVVNTMGSETNEDLFRCMEGKNVTETTDRDVTPETATSQSDHSRKHAGPHGIPCQSDYDCKFPDSTCHDGLCQCTVGLYFDPKTNTCVPRCDEYEDEMAVFKHINIKEYNKRIIWGISQKQCLLKCLSETSFFCLSAQYGKKLNGSHVCNLSDVGYRDVLQKYRENWNWMFSFIQRTKCR